MCIRDRDNTVHDISKKKDDVTSFALSSDFLSALKITNVMKKSSYEELNKAMLDYLTRQRTLGIPVSGIICAKQAKFVLFNLV